MWLAKVAVVKMQDKLELVVVEGAELTEALLYLLHHVHVLGCLSVYCGIAFVSRRVGSVQ